VTPRPLSTSRELVRLAYRDPLHISERLTLFGVQRLGPQSCDWAHEARQARPDAEREQLADELRSQSARIARIDGAVAGTPFYAALIPGYINYLWQETRMTLRLAALYGRDPCELRTSAELLSLRGVHPTTEGAEEALLAIRDGAPPAKPARRRPLRLWIKSIRQVLVFGGFLSPPKGEHRAGIRARARVAAGLVIGVGGWIVTWVFPVTFMMLMAWGCETHTRRLFRQAVVLYGGEATTPRGVNALARAYRDRGHGRRQLIRAAALALSIAFLAYADHIRNTVGVTWVTGLGFLVAVSLVIATVVLGMRR
jgi:hypothetical protein